MAMVRRFIRQSPGPAPAPPRPRTHPARPSRCCGHRRGVHPCSHAIRAPRSPSARRSCSAPRPAILTDTSKNRPASLLFDTCIKEAASPPAASRRVTVTRGLRAASHGGLQVQVHVAVGLRAHQSSRHQRSSPKRRLCHTHGDTQQARHPHASVPGLVRHVRCRLDDDRVVNEVAAPTATVTAIDGQPDAGRTCPGQRHAVSPRHRHVSVAARCCNRPVAHPVRRGSLVQSSGGWVREEPVDNAISEELP